MKRTESGTNSNTRTFNKNCQSSPGASKWMYVNMSMSMGNVITGACDQWVRWYRKNAKCSSLPTIWVLAKHTFVQITWDWLFLIGFYCCLGDDTIICFISCCYVDEERKWIKSGEVVTSFCIILSNDAKLFTFKPGQMSAHRRASGHKNELSLQEPIYLPLDLQFRGRAAKKNAE